MGYVWTGRAHVGHRRKIIQRKNNYLAELLLRAMLFFRKRNIGGIL
jgi:hypothetical protein